MSRTTPDHHRSWPAEIDAERLQRIPPDRTIEQLLDMFRECVEGIAKHDALARAFHRARIDVESAIAERVNAGHLTAAEAWQKKWTSQ